MVWAAALPVNSDTLQSFRAAVDGAAGHECGVPVGRGRHQNSVYTATCSVEDAVKRSTGKGMQMDGKDAPAQKHSAAGWPF